MDGRGASSVVVYSLLIFRAVLYAGDHCQELTASRKQEIAAYVNKRYKGPVAAPLVLATVEAQEQCYLKLRFTPSEQRGRDLVLYLAPDRRFLTSELFDSTVDPVKADRAAQERLKKALAAGQVAILGNEGAPITLTVFSDFQCPFCRRQAAIIREDLLRTHGTDVRVVFRHLPLPGHDWARKAAEETACVAAQNNNAFGGVHDFLFEHQDEVSLKNVHEKILMVLKGKVGFDFEKFDSCMENGVGSMLVEADEKLAREYDVYAVPTSFIGTIRVQGVGEVPQLLTLIRQQI